MIKDLNFPPNITASISSPNYGCTNTVSYSLNTFSCTSFCDYTYTVGSYYITWQAPAGWVQTSISSTGSNVTYTPDAASGGLLTATIHLPCGYTDTRTFTIIRGAQAPIFTASSVTTCTSSAAMSINSTCGAVSYTYTIVGNPGVIFTSNGQQTLTTADTNINFTTAGGSSNNLIKAKANYQNNISSVEVNTALVVGTPTPSAIEVLLIDYHTGKIQVQSEPAVPGDSIDYRWYKDGVLQPIYHSTFAQIPIRREVCDVGYGITVTVTNGCGTSTPTYKGVFVPCDTYFMVAPNPASSAVTVSTNESKTLSTNNKTFDEVRIFDFQGTLKKYQKFNNVKTSKINISGLISGNYFIEIISGNYKEKHQLLIQQ